MYTLLSCKALTKVVSLGPEENPAATVFLWSSAWSPHLWCPGCLWGVMWCHLGLWLVPLLLLVCTADYYWCCCPSSLDLWPFCGILWNNAQVWCSKSMHWLSLTCPFLLGTSLVLWGHWCPLHLLLERWCIVLFGCCFSCFALGYLGHDGGLVWPCWIDH